VRAAKLYRRPGRKDAHNALRKAEARGALDAALNNSFLMSSGSAWNGSGYLIDMPVGVGAGVGVASYNYSTLEAWPDYCELLEVHGLSSMMPYVRNNSHVTTRSKRRTREPPLSRELDLHADP